MRKLLLLLLAIPNILFGQSNAEENLFNHMINLKQNVSSIKQVMYEYDKNGKVQPDYRQKRQISINKNKQIEKSGDVTYSFETSAPYFISQKNDESGYRGGIWNYKYKIKKSQSKTTVLQKDSESDKIIREFTLDKNNSITALYEYRNGVKSYSSYYYEYNDRGYLVKETHLYEEAPWKIITYKLNEFDDVIEKLEADAKNGKYSYKYNFVYTYDNNNNWVTKIETQMSFDEKGKLGDKRSDFGYYEYIYKREIKY